MWENEAAHKLAFLLHPESGTQFIEFNCGGTLTVAVRGAILVPIKADTMSLTVPLKYKGKKGIQQLQEYEEGGKKIKAVLEANFAGKGFVPGEPDDHLDGDQRRKAGGERVRLSRLSDDVRRAIAPEHPAAAHRI